VAWPLCSVLLAAACCVAVNELAAGTGAGELARGQRRRWRGRWRRAARARGRPGGVGAVAGCGCLLDCPDGRKRLISANRSFAECQTRAKI